MDKYILQVGEFHLFFALKSLCYKFVYKIIGGVDADDVTAVDESYTVTEFFSFVHVVGGDDNGGAMVAYFADKVPEVTTCLRVKAGGWFVQEDDPWVIN